MNHDITHCSGTDVLIEERYVKNKNEPYVKARVICDKRETCYRYKAYLDIENNIVECLFEEDGMGYD